MYWRPDSSFAGETNRYGLYGLISRMDNLANQFILCCVLGLALLIGIIRSGRL
jgi:hypothetical protein